MSPYIPVYILLTALEQEGIIIMAYLPSYPSLVNMVSFEGSPHLVTFQNPGIDNS